MNTYHLRGIWIAYLQKLVQDPLRTTLPFVLLVGRTVLRKRARLRVRIVKLFVQVQQAKILDQHLCLRACNVTRPGGSLIVHGQQASTLEQLHKAVRGGAAPG